VAGETVAREFDPSAEPEETPRYHALIFLASPRQNPGQHLRILAQLAGHVAEAEFMGDWLGAVGTDQLRETLLRDDCFLTFHLEPGSRAAALIGRKIMDIDLPQNALAAMVRRRREMIVPRGSLVLEEGDRVSFIGEVDDIQELYDRYHQDGAAVMSGVRKLPPGGLPLPGLASEPSSD
jgi:hypothetical protein